jgi:hypothetical protein
MDAWMQDERRAAVQSARKRPSAPHRRTFTAEGDGKHGPEDAPPPTDLFLEATHPSGEIATWFDDIWWMESLRRWRDLPLVIHLVPSEAALLHPVVLHQVAMVARVAPNWRVVGYGYATEIGGDAAIERLATSTYDEIDFVEGLRPGGPGSAPPRHALRIQDLFSRVRRIQRELGATRPVLVRAKSVPPVPGEVAATKAQEQETAPQTCG